MKILYFDTETTGTDPNKNEITQFAGIVEIDGEVVEEINLRCQPTRWDDIDAQALEVTGVSLKELKKNPEVGETAIEIERFFDRHIDKYDKEDKFYPAGHNVQFDLDFLQSFFKEHITIYGTGSYQNWRSLDSRVFANFLLATGQIDVPNVKLETLCDFFGIEIDAHDALSDIRATRELVRLMMKMIDKS